MTTHVAEPDRAALAPDSARAPSAHRDELGPHASSASRTPNAPPTLGTANAWVSPTWRAWAGLGVVMGAAVLVFWSFDALPFQDLPAHAGLIAMRHRFSTSGFEQRFFVLAPHIGPYSLFRFLGEGFVRVVGPIGAVRALGTLPVVATPLAMIFARRRLFADASLAHGFLGVTL